jgi:hypothetical protein
MVRGVRSVTRVCTHLHFRFNSWREESGSLWKTCGQDDELAEQVSSALENEY